MTWRFESGICRCSVRQQRCCGGRIICRGSSATKPSSPTTMPPSWRMCRPSSYLTAWQSQAHSCHIFWHPRHNFLLIPPQIQTQECKVYSLQGLFLAAPHRIFEKFHGWWTENIFVLVCRLKPRWVFVFC